MVKLSNGGELRGRLIRNTAAGKAASESLLLETLIGTAITVAKSETQFVSMRPLVVEEYETRARRSADSLEAHWELSEWCRQKGLTKQREVHLLRVVEHDAHHEKAQAALGRVWSDGAWVDRDELMASQGYVKYKNKYITTQELDLIQKTAAELEQEREWFQKVRLWKGWIGGRDEKRRQQGLVSLQQIDDDQAAPAVVKLLCEDTQRDIRMLGASILSKLTGAKAVAGLVKLTLFDADAEIRYAALNGITEEGYEFAQPAFIKELKHEANAVVSRAAGALARVGDERAVGPLIDALVTAHRYNVPINAPSGQTYSFRSDGNFPTGASLPPEIEAAARTGQLQQGAVILNPSGLPVEPPKKTVLVRVEHWNQDVLATLQKLTQRDFGYDERTWHLWWAAEKTNGGADKSAKKKPPSA